MTHDRVAGVLVPLFSMPSSRSWGIGEFGDIPVLAGWLRRAGLGLLQLLPVHETDRNEFSPYSPLTVMALDPQFITMRDVEDFVAIGGEASLSEVARRDLEQARQRDRVDYGRVRALKDEALRRAFNRFFDTEWKSGSVRARQLEEYIGDQSWWIEAYALYRAVRASQQEAGWTSWDEPLRALHREALETARQTLSRDRLFHQYVQWIAESQWHAARHAARPVRMFGDYPFLPTVDSADVWWRQDEFRLDATAGSPPDDFNPGGQDWGLPPCDWEVMASQGDEWTRQRIGRMAALYDGYRLDHVVGFYRTFVWPRGAAGARPCFLPDSESEQLAQGERIMRIALESGAYVSVEDLGTIPDFVRESIERLALPGYKVLRWEREWQQPGQPFRDPADHPAASVATTGTHDTATLTEWWESTTPAERASLGVLPTLTRIAGDRLDFSRAALDLDTREALLELTYASGSDVLILPVQDLFGWRDRINVSGTRNDSNWTYKLPWPVDQWTTEPQSVTCAARLKAWAERHDRLAEVTE